jgi:hypothetical protein
MSRALDSFELERGQPSSFRIDEGEMIHRQCGTPMTLVQRGFSGEEQWFCTTCMERVYLPREAWLFLMEQLGTGKARKVAA